MSAEYIPPRLPYQDIELETKNILRKTIQTDLSQKLDITRQTATSYLDKLCEMQIMSVIKKRGTESKYYGTGKKMLIML